MERGQTDVGEDGLTAGGRMTCGDVRELFAEYFKGSLSPFQSVLFHEHCETCEECRSELIRESQYKAGGGSRMPARGFFRTGRRWECVGGVLFRPARVKLPLEAAALFLIVSLGWYVTHRSSPPVSAVTVNVPATETQLIDAPPAEAVQADVVPEPQTAAKPTPKPQHEPRAHFKPPMASVAPPRVVAEEPVPRNDKTLSSANSVSESDRQAANEQMAASAQGTVEAPAANTQSSGEIPADSSGKDKAPAAVGDHSVVIRELRPPPSDGTYFFLYSPSRKPL
jgi:hypothetical protein